MRCTALGAVPFHPSFAIMLHRIEKKQADDNEKCSRKKTRDMVLHEKFSLVAMHLVSVQRGRGQRALHAGLLRSQRQRERIFLWVLLVR